MQFVKTMARALVEKTVKQRRPGAYLAYAIGKQLVAAYENHDVEMESNGEHWLVKQLASRPSVTAIDVGANKGDWASAVVAHAPSAHVLCFEPIPATYAKLEEAVIGPNVTLFNMALSSQPGSLTVYAVPDNPHIASVYAGDFFQPELERQEVELQATTGDLLLTERGLDRVDIVKIDAEGHDFDVLLGFRKSVEAGLIDFIQFEYNILTLEGGRSLRDFFAFLSPQYVLCRLLPNGLEACGYHAVLDNFGQSNWVAVRADILDKQTARDFGLCVARGLPGMALSQTFDGAPAGKADFLR